MNPRVLLLALLLMGGGGAFLFFRLLSAPAPLPAGPAPEARREVLVAVHSVRPGDFLRAADFTPRSFPISKIPQGAADASLKARHGLDGAVARQELAADGVLKADGFVTPDETGFLREVLAPGMRAISIFITPVTGVSGLVEPGDQVDVVLVQQAHDGPDGHEGAAGAKGVVASARILAVGQSVRKIQVDPKKEAGGTMPSPSTATLEVSPEDVGVLSVASKMGDLVLAIRPRSSEGQASSVPQVDGEKVSMKLQNTTRRSSVRVYNGTANASNVEF